MFRNRLISQLCLPILYKITTNRMALKKWLYETLEIQKNQEDEKDSDIFELLGMLLLKIDGHFFAKLKQSEYEGGSYEQKYPTYVSYFQRYLCKKQFKRLKNNYQMQLRQSKDGNQLLKLALYLGINSSLKKDIVDRIVCFSQEEQKQLMRAIKEIQRECQQVIEIKKIIERVEVLESTNQQLKTQVHLKQNDLRLKISELNEVQQENRGLYAEIQLYSNEKIHAFCQIGSLQMQDFAYSCQTIKDQIFRSKSNYEQLSTENIKMQINNTKLKQDLKTYGKIIKQYIEQLDKLKKQHMLTNQQFVLRQISQYTNKQIVTPLPLLDTTNKNNLSLSINDKSMKIDTERTKCESQQDLSFSLKQKKCSLGLLLQISQLQKEIQEKVQKILQLKRIQSNEKDTNTKLSKRLKRIKTQHNEYMNRFISSCAFPLGLITH